jgi:hypothetical protein
MSESSPANVRKSPEFRLKMRKIALARPTNAKLTAEEAFDIFVSDLPPKVLAHRYGIVNGHVSKIKHRKNLHMEATAYCVPELLSGFLTAAACVGAPR